MKLIPVVFSNNIDHALTCPICGEDYLHPSNVTVITSSDDKGAYQIIEVHDKDTTVTTGTAEKDVASVVRTSFWCEQECAVPDLVMYPYKGNMFMGWDNG